MRPKRDLARASSVRPGLRDTSRSISSANAIFQYGQRRRARSRSLGCGFGFDQFRCTRPGQLVVGGGSPRPCRPTALLQVLALLPVGRDFSQGCQICLRIPVLQELLHADRREDCHDCGASLVSRKFVGGSAGHPTAPENPMTIDATAPIAILVGDEFRDLPRKIDGTCMAFGLSIKVAHRTQRARQLRPVLTV